MPSARRIIPCFIISLLLTCLADARLVRMWTYDELMKASDIVAVVKVSGTRDSTDRYKLEGHGDSSKFTSSLATLDAQWIIKGDQGTKQFDLLYFEYSKAVNFILNGAGFISFPKSDQREYLVFLKKRSDGVYVPVTGDYDAGMSVKTVEFFRQTFPTSK